jgi:hypothetical protein
LKEHRPSMLIRRTGQAGDVLVADLEAVGAELATAASMVIRARMKESSVPWVNSACQSACEPQGWWVRRPL